MRSRGETETPTQLAGNAPISNVVDHIDQYCIVYEDGSERDCPRAGNNRHTRQAEDWIAEGNTPTMGDPGPEKRARSFMSDDELLNAIVVELAIMNGRTTEQQEDVLIGHMQASRSTK